MKKIYVLPNTAAHAAANITLTFVGEHNDKLVYSDMNCPKLIDLWHVRHAAIADQAGRYIQAGLLMSVALERATKNWLALHPYDPAPPAGTGRQLAPSSNASVPDDDLQMWEEYQAWDKVNPL